MTENNDQGTVFDQDSRVRSSTLNLPCSGNHFPLIPVVIMTSAQVYTVVNTISVYLLTTCWHYVPTLDGI